MVSSDNEGTEGTANETIPSFLVKASRRGFLTIGGVTVAVVVAGGAAYYLLGTPSTDGKTDSPGVEKPTATTPNIIPGQQPVPTPVPVTKKEIVIGIQDSFVTTYPPGMGFGVSDAEWAMSSVFETLFYNSPLKADGSRDRLPLLAQSLEQVDGLKVMRLKLRDGVKFHNGEPLTAEAIDATIDAYRGNYGKSLTDFFFFGLDSTKINDDLTITFTFKGPGLTNLQLLDSTMRLFVLSPKALKEFGKENIANNPVGTGPFRFESWEPDQRMTFTRDPNYWGDKLPPSERGPYLAGKGNLEKFTVVKVKEPAALMTALIAGQIDVAQSLLPSHALQIKARKELNVIDTGPIRILFVNLNSKKAPLDDVRVRKAINYATDRNGLMKLYENLMEEANFPIGPGQLGYDPQAKNYPFDLNKAKQLMTEAGYKDGFTLVMGATSYGLDPARIDLAHSITQMLRNIGIDGEVNQAEIGSWRKFIFAGEFHSYPYTFELRSVTFIPDTLYTKKARHPHIDSPDLDAIMDKANRAKTVGEVDTHLREAGHYIMDQALGIYLMYLHTFRGAKENVALPQWKGDSWYFPRNVVVN